MEDETEPDAVCNEHAAERAVSRSSLGVDMGNMVSKGANLSEKAVTWTDTRANWLT